MLPHQLRLLCDEWQRRVCGIIHQPQSQSLPLPLLLLLLSGHPTPLLRMAKIEKFITISRRL